MAPPALDNTMGVMYVGIVLSGILYGMTCLQTWYYFQEYYATDTFWIKLLVVMVCLFDTVHQALITHTDEFLFSYPESEAEVLFNGLLALLVQGFFVMRIYRLSNQNIYLSGGVGILVLTQFLLIIAYTAQAFELKTYVELNTKLHELTLSINAITAATDVLIAVILCTMLHSSRTGFKRSDTMITKLIIFTVNTGLLTSIDAICGLATGAAYPNTFIYILFFFALGRLYANSLLASLNARRSVRAASQNEDGATSVSLQRMALPLGSVSRTETNLAIRIGTSQQSAHDLEARQNPISLYAGG
ncbi:uncharacterized protein STEHIDRAFT_158158 [Stereum hirsutum FP-91666 SS1]|uniref:uncharacterized protein n=1 Tax=Stereum hirsutum (strain FP-91666) TaxID=721885 RepID=UPI0004449F5F|nr:uncharacterized protein STEHIDRAFT_158158 [Stereum hirsutum FP-91666 SS1]EIM85530.1 hypothetical protein STEHIDRAFT_158158 [Stereum hirsutum FP-91666 SS1]